MDRIAESQRRYEVYKKEACDVRHVISCHNLNAHYKRDGGEGGGHFCKIDESKRYDLNDYRRTDRLVLSGLTHTKLRKDPDLREWLIPATSSDSSSEGTDEDNMTDMSDEDIWSQAGKDEGEEGSK